MYFKNIIYIKPHLHVIKTSLNLKNLKHIDKSSLCNEERLGNRD